MSRRSGTTVRSGVGGGEKGKGGNRRGVRGRGRKGEEGGG